MPLVGYLVAKTDLKKWVHVLPPRSFRGLPIWYFFPEAIWITLPELPTNLDFSKSVPVAVPSDHKKADLELSTPADASPLLTKKPLKIEKISY